MRSGMERNQVIWRLANWRVAMMPSSRSVLCSAAFSIPSPWRAALASNTCHTAHGGQIGVQIAPCAQGAHLVDKALVQHRVKALRDARMQPSTLFGF